MPFINNLRARNNEPVYILKKDWLALINAGIIGPKTQIIYYILDDFVDPGAGKTFIIGEGLLLEAETNTVSVDANWIGDQIASNPNIRPNNVDGYHISKDGSDGLVVNEDGELHIGDKVIFHGDDIIGQLYVDENGRIGSVDGFVGHLYGTADYAIMDQRGQTIDESYVKELDVVNGNIEITRGDDTTETVPLPAGTAYTGGTGIDVTNNVITNTGVTSVSPSANAGCLTITVNGTAREVAVTGLTSVNGTPAVTGNVEGYTSGGASVLRNFGYGSAAATTANCPAGSIYGKYES